MLGVLADVSGSQPRRSKPASSGARAKKTSKNNSSTSRPSWANSASRKSPEAPLRNSQKCKYLPPKIPPVWPFRPAHTTGYLSKTQPPPANTPHPYAATTSANPSPASSPSSTPTSARNFASSTRTRNTCRWTCARSRRGRSGGA